MPVLVRRVPDDDLLGLVVARSVGDVAVDGAELRRTQRDRDIFSARALANPVPARTQLDARKNPRAFDAVVIH